MQFDECHKAKNLMNEAGNPTLTGIAVRHIQDKIPSAAVVYSSATGISEPNNMAYMVRLGNFGHSNMNELIKSLIESGLGASELFSCSLKSQGIYVARYAPSQFDSSRNMKSFVVSICGWFVSQIHLRERLHGWEALERVYCGTLLCDIPLTTSTAEQSRPQHPPSLEWQSCTRATVNSGTLRRGMQAAVL